VQAEIIKFDEFELDLGRYELRRQGQPLKLEKLPMELLILLAEREGQLVTREEIIQRVWGDNVYVDTRQGINTAVRKIRLALKDDPDQPRILLTVVGKGYRLLAPIVIAPGGETGVETAGTIDAAPEPSAGPDLKPASETPPAIAPSAAPTGAVAPVVDPALARALFLVIQAGYLTLYGAAFAHLPGIRRLALPAGTAQFTLIAGLLGAAVHLYLSAAVAFNFPGSGRLFRQIFPAVLALDVLWSASPLFLFERWGELTLLFVAMLAFLPFSQRTLMRSAYGVESGRRV
jgi:DNA-binding winged helix-turn-helix (wHTH) protein